MLRDAACARIEVSGWAPAPQYTFPIVSPTAKLGMNNIDPVIGSNCVAPGTTCAWHLSLSSTADKSADVSSRSLN
jgi:hypothetical protein